MKKRTAKPTLTFEFETDDGNSYQFKARGRKRIDLGDGIVLVNATIKAKCGRKYPAVLVIDERSSGEHCGTYFLLPSGIISQADKDFLKHLGLDSKDDLFPYTYRLHAKLHCEDIHTAQQF